MKVVSLMDIGLLYSITSRATGYPPSLENLRAIFVTGGHGVVSDCENAYLLLDFLYRDCTPTVHIAATSSVRRRTLIDFIKEGAKYARELGYNEVYSHQSLKKYNKGLRLFVSNIGGTLYKETKDELIYQIKLDSKALR